MGLIKQIQTDLEMGAVRLFNEYYARLLADARELYKDEGLAEDAAMTTLEQFISCREKYDPEKGELYPWLKTIMRNNFISSKRVRKNTDTLYVSPDELKILSDSQANPLDFDEKISSDEERIVVDAVKTLSPKLREAVMLHYFDDQPLANIARYLKISESSVKNRLFCARKILAHRLADKLGKKKPLAILLCLLLGAGALFGAWQAGVAILDNFNKNNQTQTTQVKGQEVPKMNTLTKLATPLIVATLSTTAPAANVTPLTPSDATVREVETGVYRYDYKGKKVLVFANPGEYQVTLPDNVTSLDYLVVGGGGGGGYSYGGGGGAGGYLESANSRTDVAGVALEITVGAGGAGGTSGHYDGYPGEESSLKIGDDETITAKGGGYGGGYYKPGGDGGSGGGASGHNGSTMNPGNGIMGQGNAGGSSNGGNVGGGGGGGAGDKGANAAGAYAIVPTSGGPGKTSSITGSEVVYAKGGEGGVHYSFGEVGMDGTGNGGGGGAGSKNGTNFVSWNGKKGGSGIVILSYTVSGPSPDDPIPLGEPIAYEWGWSNVVETADRYDCVIAFTNAGEYAWTLPQNATDLDYLVVGGGAGGGYNYGGGGGAGGYCEASELLTGVEGKTLAIIVGAGGAGGINGSANGGQGGDSSLQIGDSGAIVAQGGGYGGGNWANGGAGGSGGGNGGYDGTGLSKAAAQGVAGQGNNGGLSSKSEGNPYYHYYGGGGGGGAGGAGATADVESASRVTLGGVGRESSISGKVVEYANGGAGGARYATGVAGKDGTGNGGGGGKASVAGLKGGNGIVIIRYPTEPADKVTVNFTCDTTRQGFTATVGGQSIADGAKISLGSVVTVVAKPNKGYGYKSLPLDWNWGAESKTITRNFTADANPLQIDIPNADQLETYTFKLNTGDHGTVAVSPEEETYYWGDQITLTATPDAGYGFVGWSGSVTRKETTIQITMDGNKEVSATFGFELTILPSEYGVIEGATSGDVFEVGADVCLTVIPNAGYTFVAWGGDASGSTPTTTIKMDRPRTVQACFKDDQGRFLTDWGYSNVVKVAGVKRCVLAFTKVGTQTLPLPSNVREMDYLVVGGGGGGGGCWGGGGGAGGLIASNGVTIAKGTTLSVLVGAGGAGGAGGASAPKSGNKGSESKLSYGSVSLVADGGGPGASTWLEGDAGGSGGGCGSQKKGSGGSATQVNNGGMGNKGGDGLVAEYKTGAGGGGASGEGGDNSSSVPGAGGLGFESFITGESAFYAAGGGGGADSVDGAAGGSGIGGNGGRGTKYRATNGMDGTGSGGGGGDQNNPAGKGGDGIVIVSYPLVAKGIVLMIH